MFSAVRDASKVALAHLCAFLAAAGYVLLDCQDWSAHLQTLGASLMPRSQFVALLQRNCYPAGMPGSWQSRFDGFMAQADSLPWQR